MEYLVILILIASVAMILVFWKKPELLSITLFIPVILGIVGAILHPPSPCSYSPETNTVFTIMGVFFVAILLATLVFLLAGAYQWIKYSKDLSKRKAAAHRMAGGIMTIILAVVFFIIINVIIQALGVGSLACIDIPTLKEIEAF